MIPAEVRVRVYSHYRATARVWSPEPLGYAARRVLYSVAAEVAAMLEADREGGRGFALSVSSEVIELEADEGGAHAARLLAVAARAVAISLRLGFEVVEAPPPHAPRIAVEVESRGRAEYLARELADSGHAASASHRVVDTNASGDYIRRLAARLRIRVDEISMR